jgi:hypothetical protein
MGTVGCEFSSLGDFEVVGMLYDSSAARFRGFVAMMVWWNNQLASFMTWLVVVR